MFLESYKLKIFSTILLFSVTIFTSQAEERTGPTVEEFGCYDLWYARNSIFADYGYCFKTKKAKFIFSEYASNCNSKMKPFDSEAKDFLKKIRSLERKKGCPSKLAPINFVQPDIKVKDSNKYIVSGIKSTLNVRMKPSIKGKLINFLPNGVGNIEIIGYSKNRKWAYIKYANYTNYKEKGWVYSKYLKRENIEKNKIGYKKKLRLLNTVLNKCGENEKSPLDIYMNQKHIDDTFYESYDYMSVYDCVKIDSELYKCRAQIDFPSLWNTYIAEGCLCIEFIVEKEGNDLKIKNVEKCILAG